MKFAYDVSVLLDITVDDVRTLQICAARHYDGVCKSAGMVGGFIYGWMNRFTLFTNGDEPTEIYATARELGTCLKSSHWELRTRLHLAGLAIAEEHSRVNGIQR